MASSNTTPQASSAGDGAEQSAPVRCSHCHSTLISALADNTNEFVCRECNRIFRREDTSPPANDDAADDVDDGVVMRCSRCNSTIDPVIDSLILSSKRRVCRSCNRSLSSDDAQPVHNTEREVAIARDIETILDAILWSLSDPDLEHPEVIMLLGNPGVGKSEIMNTIHAALIGKYGVIATPGAGSAQTITMDINWYKNCGVTQHKIEDPNRRERMAPLVNKLPHILDVAGFSDELKHETLLELLIGGYISPGTNIVDLQERDETSLRIEYHTPRPEWKVNKICFVESVGTNTIPNKLIECLQSVLRIVDPKTHRRKYTASVYLILSKWDLVEDPTENNVYALDDRKQNHSVTIQDATKKHDGLLPLFNMIGVAGIFSRRWSSFMSETGFDNVYIKKNALEFLKLLVEHRAPTPPPPPPPRDCLTMLKLFLYDLWKVVKSILQKAYRLCGALAVPVAILAILIVLLTKGV